MVMCTPIPYLVVNGSILNPSLVSLPQQTRKIMHSQLLVTSLPFQQHPLGLESIHHAQCPHLDTNMTTLVLYYYEVKTIGFRIYEDVLTGGRTFYHR